jgi:catechol 2,3-dioxygenase-like lactoylglutathione lyase family enzyme
MPATRINHTSIVANSLDESARFYEELFGMERIATAKFSDPVLWLRAGTSQLHLFEADETATLRAHVSFDVDDFDALYAKAKEMGILDSNAFGSALRIHPAGWAQLYLRDPAGNLVEVDWHDVSSLSAETLAEASELGGQQGEAATATLFTAQERLTG